MPSSTAAPSTAAHQEDADLAKGTSKICVNILLIELSFMKHLFIF